MLSFSGSNQGKSGSWISCPQLPGPLLLLATPAHNGVTSQLHDWEWCCSSHGSTQVLTSLLRLIVVSGGAGLGVLLCQIPYLTLRASAKVIEHYLRLAEHPSPLPASWK